MISKKRKKLGILVIHCDGEGCYTSFAYANKDQHKICTPIQNDWGYVNMNGIGLRHLCPECKPKFKEV